MKVTCHHQSTIYSTIVRFFFFFMRGNINEHSNSENNYSRSLEVQKQGARERERRALVDTGARARPNHSGS